MKKNLLLLFLLFLGNFVFAQDPIVKKDAWGHEMAVYNVRFTYDPLQGCNNQVTFTVKDNVPEVSIDEYYYQAQHWNVYKIRVQGPQGPNRAYSLKSQTLSGWTFNLEENVWESSNWMSAAYGLSYDVSFPIEANTVTDTPVALTVSLIFNPDAVPATDPLLQDDPSNNVAVGYTKVATVCGGSSNVTNNTIIINSTTQTASTGSSVTLTAQGCTGGTFTWSPAGGTVGGTNNNTYTVTTNTPGPITYTATCSLGGNGSSTITWQNGVVCAANAGTLN